ncbi:Rossmann-like and DUF2520 domain-containing protein [Marinirhabdus gelatinilytica]|uniref:Putative short-subunit dehydrogenase-like oxidoreductase (DUF2520 family) n=1 Tax=Marinirhabdus gelatinilytica TaxID=1703343 RepID=A0A370QB17_9FLAO|nr:DUF2520 domain-containing protein [Marinirhabdus gelatinilytica]RDK85563.1 putative short-subunit dehydrogenase-like oxidoreductase (DUF2520 family) [Marinirhabdus gelatinilytica]
MTTVVLLGFGNVGQHLYKAFSASEKVKVVQIYNRNFIETLQIPQCQDTSKLVEAHVYIIAVPDQAIGNLSAVLPFNGRFVVHTSGGVRMDVLSENNKRGVFYPLQTFSKDTKVDFSSIPICIEAEQKTDLALLKTIGSAVSEKVVEISSEEREKLHVAAVFVNNFSNHLYQIAETITKKNGLDFDILKPLITETARKVQRLPPAQAQTGPAKRNDKKTIEKHLKLLKDSEYGELYEKLTESIKNSG